MAYSRATLAETESTMVTYDHIFKIILIGDNAVGKSSFIRRFCEGNFVGEMETTIGVDFYLTEIDVSGKKIKVKIWDTAGSEKYMSISAVYYRKADGVIFVFDVTKPRSFTDIETVWMQAVEAPEHTDQHTRYLVIADCTHGNYNGCPEAVKVLVGNKCDLPADVDLSQAKKYADLHDMEFIETSAKTNYNIQEAFVRLASEICELKSQQAPSAGYETCPSLSLPRSNALIDSDKNDSCMC